MRCESCASWTNEALCKDRLGIDPNYPCIHYHPVPSAAADLNKCGNRGKDSERVPVPLSGKEESEGKTSKVGGPSRGGSLSIPMIASLQDDNRKLRYALERACKWIAKHHGCPVEANETISCDNVNCDKDPEEYGECWMDGIMAGEI